MGLKGFDCDLPGIRLHAVSSPGQGGKSGPLALMFHGITANGYVFAPIIETLARDFRAISFDQRGHGRSDKPATGYGGEEHAEDIAGAIRWFDSGRRCSSDIRSARAMPWSRGLRHPELVAAVVAIDFTPFIETQVFDDLEARVQGGDRVFESLAAAERYLADRYKRLPPDAVERRARYGFQSVEGGLRPLADPQAMIQIAHGLREDLEPVLRDIAVPTLLIRGKDSKLVSPEAWARTRALRPDIHAMELEGADHYVPEEVPDAVAGAVREFWKGIKK